MTKKGASRIPCFEQHLVGLVGPPLSALGQPLDLGLRQPREEDRIAEFGEHLGLHALRTPEA
jgi:hypothetical protein